MKTKLLISAFAISLIIACVPAKKYEAVKSKKDICEEQLAGIKDENRKLSEDYTELKQWFDDLDRKYQRIVEDTIMMGRGYRLLRRNYDKINESYELLLAKNKQLLQGSQAETEALFKNLQLSQSQLQLQTDSLIRAKRILDEKQQKLDKLESELIARSKKVDELEAILSKKDSAVNALKQKVQNALLGFENNGLTIEQKNGKVYVSLDESLLFKSGSYQVDAKGKTVLNKLGKLLEKNEDVNVLVEGHTDNVPLNGSGTLKDNWDLSVMRATSVVKIITGSSKMNPDRLTAAGRGDLVPIASNDTEEGRKKNRRTEIILTPKLDELFEILETN